MCESYLPQHSKFSSSETYNSFKTEFSNQMNGDMFEIVLAVGNKIVSPNVAGGIDGRVLKHVCAEGSRLSSMQNPIRNRLRLGERC